jgi:hypothetical protein
MKMIRIYLLVLLTISMTKNGMSQQVGFDFPPGVKSVTIPFESYNNLIIIPVTINNAITLKFILDTGVQYPILTEKLFGDFINLEYARRIAIQGPGTADSITAKVVQNISLTLPGGVKSGINQALLVLEKDYLKLKNSLGIDVYGLIGYDIFSRFIVEINYDESFIKLHEPKKFRPKRSYKKIPIKVVNTKPYIEVGISKDSSKAHRKHLMIDTGASHALLLDNADEETLLPNQSIPSIIGKGLGGNINGYLARMTYVTVGKFEFLDPIASFPLEGNYGESIKRGSRNGTLGGELLSRFSVAFDYFNGYIYLKKGRGFSRGFEHDMSGMGLAANGEELDMLEVDDVRLNSPAFYAGLRKGDNIKSINGYTLDTIKFSDFTSLLRMKEGKKIVVKYTREGESYKTSFKLERYI